MRTHGNRRTHHEPDPQTHTPQETGTAQICLVLLTQPGQHDDASALVAMELTDEREFDELDTAARSTSRSRNPLGTTPSFLAWTGKPASVSRGRSWPGAPLPTSVSRLNQAGRDEVSVRHAGAHICERRPKTGSLTLPKNLTILAARTGRFCSVARLFHKWGFCLAGLIDFGDGSELCGC